MNANINYDEIPDTSAVQEDLLAALSSQHVTVHTNEEPDFDYMENGDVAFGVKNPHNDENLLIELGGEFSLFFGLWHGQYKAVEYDYDRMKKDIAAILEGNAGALSLYADGNWYVEEPREIPVLDRIGGGDGFSGGLLYGVLNGWEAEKCLQFGWASGVLAASSLNDYAEPADKKQVWDFYKGNARVQR